MQQTELDKSEEQKIRSALEESDSSVADISEDYHPSEIAILFEQLTKEEQERMINILPSGIASEAISEMDDEQHP